MMMKSVFALLQHTLFFFLLLLSSSWSSNEETVVAAFVPRNPPHASTTRHRHQHSRSSSSSTVRVGMSSSSNQFDMSKPVFDLYSLRSVRGDALTKYNSLNQSEPLRINLAALFTLSFLSSPFLSEDLVGSALTIPQTCGAVLGALGGAALFTRECQRRSRQLTRLEKELAALDLSIRLPTNAIADAPFQGAATIRHLQRKAGLRLLAIYGTADQLKSSLQQLSIYGRRMKQSNTYVVAISSDGSQRRDWGISRGNRLEWLAAAESPNQEWQRYFEGISDDSQTSTFKWFGLSATGRSFGSGQGSEPSWLQLFGRHLRPTEMLDDTGGTGPSTTDDVGSNVLEQHRRFYSALTEGDVNEMEGIFSKDSDLQVTEVHNSGGRLDSWKSCLAEGARPEGMKVSDVCVTVLSDNLAYTTCIEFPKLIFGATLLAVQEWTREGEDATGGAEWKLAKHQTIPWTTDNSAGGMLICDARGCVSLVRS